MGDIKRSSAASSATGVAVATPQHDKDKTEPEPQASPTLTHTELVTAKNERAAEVGEYEADPEHPLAVLSSVRKHVLLLIFSIATFVDVCEYPFVAVWPTSETMADAVCIGNVSGVAIAVAQIAVDIDLKTSQTVWVSPPHELAMHCHLSDYMPRLSLPTRSALPRACCSWAA